MKIIINEKINTLYEVKRSRNTLFTAETLFFKSLFEKCLTLKQGENFIIDTHYKNKGKSVVNESDTKTGGELISNYMKENKILNALNCLSLANDNFYYGLAYNKNYQFVVVCCSKKYQPKFLIKDANSAASVTVTVYNALDGSKEEIKETASKSYRFYNNEDIEFLRRELAKIDITLKQLKKVEVIKQTK